MLCFYHLRISETPLTLTNCTFSSFHINCQFACFRSFDRSLRKDRSVSFVLLLKFFYLFFVSINKQFCFFFHKMTSQDSCDNSKDKDSDSERLLSEASDRQRHLIFN